MNYKRIYQITLIALLLGLFFITAQQVYTGQGNGYQTSQVDADSTSDKSDASKAAKSKPKKTDSKLSQDSKDMIALDDFKYTDSSEKKDYPDLMQHPEAFIDVDIALQRVFIKEGDKVLYEMYASTGKNDTTPRGTYHIENERGEYFYTQPLKLGAYYYTSFLDHGVYLFHTTPTDENKVVVPSIAKTLGREPSSHGCVHLSDPDCKWIYDKVPAGTKVVIHGTFKS